MGFAFAGGDIWPLSRTEPGIKGVFVAAIGFAVFFDLRELYPVVVNPIRWVVDILEGWDRNTPRDLAGDIPVFELLEIVEEDLLFAGGVKFDLPFLENLDGAGGERFDVDKPLLFEEWLDDSVALVAVTNRVLDLLFPSKEVLFLEVFENFFARLCSGEVFVVCASFFGHFAIKTDNSYHVEFVALAYFIVIRVVCWCNFYNTSTKSHIGVLVGNNWNFAVR